MIRVAVAPCDVLSVYNYRTRWPAETLAKQGVIKLIELEQDLVLREAMREHGPSEVVGVMNPPDVDVLVYTRLMAGRMVDAIPLLQAQGIAVVVDLDDNFKMTPPGLTGSHRINPNYNKSYNWKHLQRACKLADLFTCSTPALQAYAGRAVVLRNYVPERYTSITTQKRGLTVGWAGAITAHPGDLDVTRGGVAAAIRETDAEFMVVGDPTGVKISLGLDKEPWATGIVSHEEYSRRCAEMDVAIAPLAGNAYTEAKSWVKPLQYMALGAQWLASDSPEYVELGKLTQSHCEGVGAVVRSRGREWRRDMLRALQRPENERQELSLAGRQFVKQQMSIEVNSWRWAEAWLEAIKVRREKASHDKRPAPTHSSRLPADLYVRPSS